MSADDTLAPTLREALHGAIAQGLDRLDAQMLLLHVVDRRPHDRAWLLAHDTDRLTAAALSRFQALVARRRTGEPVAYLLGEKEFHGLTLAVDARVLVPRPDTETLVEWALAMLPPPDEVASSAPLAGRPRLLDLGTGSGAIALAVQHARPDALVDAVDASADALAVAQTNAQTLGLPVRFSQSDWLTGAADGYDVIVSNPPYIVRDDAHLHDLRYEPLTALVSGADGLDDIRRIVHDAPHHLKAGGWLLLEHGYDQAPQVRSLLAQRGFDQVASRRDLSDIERCTGGRWLGRSL